MSIYIGPISQSEFILRNPFTYLLRKIKLLPVISILFMSLTILPSHLPPFMLQYKSCSIGQLSCRQNEQWEVIFKILSIGWNFLFFYWRAALWWVCCIAEVISSFHANLCINQAQIFFILQLTGLREHSTWLKHRVRAGWQCNGSSTPGVRATCSSNLLLLKPSLKYTTWFRSVIGHAWLCGLVDQTLNSCGAAGVLQSNEDSVSTTAL